MQGHFHEEIDERYREKPRPSLYNVIAKQRERGGPAPSRFLYVAKIKESKAKDNLEKEMNDYFQKHVQDEEVGMTGILLVMGNYVVHLIEAEREPLKQVILDLQAEVNKPDTIYLGMWITYHSDENAS